MKWKSLLACLLFGGCSKSEPPPQIGSSGNWNEIVTLDGKVVGRFPNFRMDTNGVVHLDPESVKALKSLSETP